MKLRSGMWFGADLDEVRAEAIRHLGNQPRRTYLYVCTD